MVGPFISQNPQAQETVPKEGDLYKVIQLHGHTFPLYYGYYEMCDRDNPAVDPMPIYPDFIAEPRYTDEGFAFTTKMQDSCKHYVGKTGKFSECAECHYYLHGEELLGICTCPRNKQSCVNSG